MFQFNIIGHNIILNDIETEQKDFAVCLPKMLIFLKILVNHLILGFVLVFLNGEL